MTEKEAIKDLIFFEDKLHNGIFGYKIGCLDAAIKALEEIQQYREIGTVEECREAIEKQNAKEPVEYEGKYYACPNCDNLLMPKWERYPFQLKDKKKWASVLP